jgi:hypothetical protein
MIGALGQERDIHFAFALHVQVRFPRAPWATSLLTVLQLSSSATPTYLDAGEGQISTCGFTTACRRNTPEYSADFVTDRALRNIACTPIFKQPKLLMIPVKHEQPALHGNTHQVWYPWQVCTNCLAVRAKSRCSLWAYSIQVQELIAVYELRPGETSDDDTVYGWFTDYRDAFLGKDLGFYY